MSQKPNSPFLGVCTALITPFSNGDIDWNSLNDLIEAQIEGGVNAICILGTTGEAVTLTEGERMRLIAHCIDRIDKRVKCIVGVGSPSTQKSKDYAIYAWGRGADGLLLSTPYYNKGTYGGITAHFHTVADATDLPLILYHVPGRTGVNLSIPHVEEIVKHPRIVGIKEASDSAGRPVELMARMGETVHLYAGNDNQFVPTLAIGGSGVISVISNLLPGEWCDIWHLWQAGKPEEAAKRQLALEPLIHLLFEETNPAPIKCAMSLAGICKDEVRLPMMPVHPLLKEKIRLQLGLPHN